MFGAGVHLMSSCYGIRTEQRPPPHSAALSALRNASRKEHLKRLLCPEFGARPVLLPKMPGDADPQQLARHVGIVGYVGLLKCSDMGQDDLTYRRSSVIGYILLAQRARSVSAPADTAPTQQAQSTS